MRYAIQAVSVFAIGLGIGMLVAGAAAEPSALVVQLGDGRAEVSMSSHDIEFFHSMSIALKGFGAGFLTLGVLSLVIPWINTIVDELRTRRAPTNPPTSQELA